MVSGLVHNDHLLVLRESAISVYRLDSLPRLELVNAIEISRSMETARKKMGRMSTSGSRTADAVEAGRKIALRENRADCQRINGSGGTLDPGLGHAGRDRTLAWIEKKITDPKAANPKSMMPAYKLLQDDLRDLAGCLASLK